MPPSSPLHSSSNIIYYLGKTEFATVAQLVEQLIRNQ